MKPNKSIALLLWAAFSIFWTSCMTTTPNIDVTNLETVEPSSKSWGFYVDRIVNATILNGEDKIMFARVKGIRRHMMVFSKRTNGELDIASIYFVEGTDTPPPHLSENTSGNDRVFMYYPVEDYQHISDILKNGKSPVIFYKEYQDDSGKLQRVAGVSASQGL